MTKICRSIMSKLTVTHDLQFRGTLQRFLAKSLPLTHKSGKQAHWHEERTRKAATRSKSENLSPDTQPWQWDHPITKLNSTNWFRLQLNGNVQHFKHDKYRVQTRSKATEWEQRHDTNCKRIKAVIIRLRKHRDEWWAQSRWDPSRI